LNSPFQFGSNHLEKDSKKQGGYPNVRMIDY